MANKSTCYIFSQSSFRSYVICLTLYDVSGSSGTRSFNGRDRQSVHHFGPLHRLEGQAHCGFAVTMLTYFNLLDSRRSAGELGLLIHIQGTVGKSMHDAISLSPPYKWNASSTR